MNKGTHLTEKSKIKISKSMKIKWKNGEYRAKCIKNHGGMTGRKHTEEAKSKMSVAREGKTYKEFYGVKKAEEIKKKQSKVRIEFYKNPKNLTIIKNINKRIGLSQRGKSKPYMIGDNNPSKRLDVRKKISRSLKGRKCIWMYGDKNPMHREEVRKKVSDKTLGVPKPSSQGKKNHFYKDGKGRKPYPMKWRTQRGVIRKRDRGCAICGITNKRNIKIEHCSLHVHHIDGNKKNIEEFNLISLCRFHHSKIATFYMDLQDHFHAKLLGLS